MITCWLTSFTALRYPTAEIAFCDRMVSPDYLRQFLNCKNKTPGGHKPNPIFT